MGPGASPSGDQICPGQDYWVDFHYSKAIWNPFRPRYILLYDDVIMSAIASQITSLTIVYSIVYSDVDQRKHQSSASLAFVRGIHRGPVSSPHNWPITRKYFHLMTSPWALTFSIHWNGNVFILMKFSSLAALEVVKMTKWQLPLQPVIKISSKWRHFRFSVGAPRRGHPGGIWVPNLLRDPIYVGKYWTDFRVYNTCI